MRIIAVLKKFFENFSYVFLVRTLYLLRLDPEGSGRAVRA